MTDHMYVLIGSEQLGPISEAEVRARISSGEVDGTTLIWYPGLEQWQALEEVRGDLLKAASDRFADVGARTVMIEDLTGLVDEVEAEDPEPIENYFEPESAAEDRTLVAVSYQESFSETVAPIDDTEPDLEAAEPLVTPSGPSAGAAPVLAATARGEGLPAAATVRRWESHGTVFEILYSDLHQMPKITLRGNSCVLEAGALHYMRGKIEIEVPKAKLSGFMKGALTKEAGTRPRYTGTGEVYLEPTFGEINVLEIAGDAWVLDRGSFLAADAGVEVGVFTNKAWSGLLGGEGFFQTKVSGKGKVFFLSDGVCERIELKDEKLVVDGSFAVARTAGLEFNVEKATKGLIGTLRSGEGLVNVIRGTGVVLIAPIPNRSQRLFRRLDLLGQMMSSRKR
jgi:uncharacterized protein (AIM24 family)